MAEKPEIAYGSIETEGRSPDGSIVTTVENIVKGVVVHPLKRKYTSRHRVTDMTQEYQVYKDISDRIHADPLMLDPTIVIEIPKIKGKGYYDLVFSFIKFEL